jgi:uncharacterized protein YndB with AHSA1/START domain
MSTTEVMTVKVTRHFDATPERVFDAWLDPQMVRRFLFATPTGEMVRVDIDGRVGGKFLIVRRTNGDDVEHVGEYLVIERPRRLVFTFAVPRYSSQSTLVSIDIVPSATGCTLTLAHEGVLPEWADRTQDGWGMILNALDGALDDMQQQPYAELTAPNTITLDRLLPGPIERVWQYIADSDKRRTWLGSGHMEQKVGTTFSLYLRNSDLSTIEEPTPPHYAKHDAGYITECRITQCDPPKALAFVWDETSEITITLSPAGDHVRLRLTHRQVSGNVPMSGFGAAWHTHLGFLADHMNGRDPGSFWKMFGRNEAAYERRQAEYDSH